MEEALKNAGTYRETGDWAKTILTTNLNLQMIQAKTVWIIVTNHYKPSQK